jgi:hypothetical protein
MIRITKATAEKTKILAFLVMGGGMAEKRMSGNAAYQPDASNGIVLWVPRVFEWGETGKKKPPRLRRFFG